MQQTNNIQPTPSHPLAHSSWPFRHFSISIATQPTHIYNITKLTTPNKIQQSPNHTLYISNNYVFLKSININIKSSPVYIKRNIMNVKSNHVYIKSNIMKVKSNIMNVKSNYVYIKSNNMKVKSNVMKVKSNVMYIKSNTFEAAIAFSNPNQTM